MLAGYPAQVTLLEPLPVTPTSRNVEDDASARLRTGRSRRSHRHPRQRPAYPGRVAPDPLRKLRQCPAADRRQRRLKGTPPHREPQRRAYASAFGPKSSRQAILHSLNGLLISPPRRRRTSGSVPQPILWEMTKSMKNGGKKITRLLPAWSVLSGICAGGILLLLRPWHPQSASGWILLSSAAVAFPPVLLLMFSLGDLLNRGILNNPIGLRLNRQGGEHRVSAMRMTYLLVALLCAIAIAFGALILIVGGIIWLRRLS